MKNVKISIGKGKKYGIRAVTSVIAAGFISGFFGAGGGAVLIMLSGARGEGQKDAFASTSVLTAMFSAVSVFGYIKSGDIQAGVLQSTVLPAFIGGGIGALLLDRINGRILSLLFGVISAVGGLLMLLR
jgi:uncharacterized membrane protein YfcA